MKNKRTAGFWVLMIFGIIMLIILIFGQVMSFINYEFTVSLGLQESIDVIGEAGVAVNKGIGAGDTIIYLPLLIAGLAGLWLRKRWGVFTMFGAMAITAYWPLVSLFFFIFAKGTPDFYFTEYTSYSILLTAFTLCGLWGLWYLYKNQKILADDH